jgi:hypothetical protein
MPVGGVCPVCEIPHDAEDGAQRLTVERPADSVLGRFWQSGRLASLVAAVCFAFGTVVPFFSIQRADHLGAVVSKSVLDMLSAAEPYGRELKSTMLMAIPGAAVFLATMVWTRRTRSSMTASRPLLLVVAILPLVAAVFKLLVLGKHHRFEHTLGPGFALVAFGSIAGIVGAIQFGRGVSDEPGRRRDDEDGD